MLFYVRALNVLVGIIIIDIVELKYVCHRGQPHLEGRLGCIGIPDVLQGLQKRSLVRFILDVILVAFAKCIQVHVERIVCVE